MNAEQLISEDNFQKATHLERFRLASKLLMNLTGIHKLNHLYAKAADAKGNEFIEKIFKELDFHFQLNEKELQHIPSEGPFITISNHPFGALDGLLLLYLVRKRRTDFKVMANFLLKEVRPLEEAFIAVNPFESRKALASSLAGTKAAIQHLKEGGGLGIFPAGEVSTFRTQGMQVVDKQWQNAALRLIQKAEVPIIPIHFKGSNSLLFHVLGLIHDDLRTLALPSELFKRKKAVKVRIGKPIGLGDQKMWPETDGFGRYLRAKTYCLESKSLKLKHVFKEKLPRLKHPKAIALSESSEKLAKEISGLQEFKILEQAEFELYLCPANKIPKMLREIGIQREITFRAVGEGSNKAVDLDEYDWHFLHLILWDKKAQKLAGAYRLGNGKEIFQLYGKKGFYIHSLFKLKSELNPVLKQSLELGRSFVCKAYQQKRLPLFLLWKGITHYLGQNENIQYILGPVSISNNYSSISRMLMVEYIKRFHFDKQLAQYVKPRKDFKIKFKKVEGEALLKGTDQDLKKIDRIISDIEPSHAPIPVLIKKYIKQNAKIIGFNLDPKFNSALDGLIILKLADMPESFLKELKEIKENI